MRSAKVFCCFLGIAFICAMTRGLAAQTSPSNQRIVIGASQVFDGKGHKLQNRRIVVEGAKIVAVEPLAGPVDYDVRVAINSRLRT